MKLRREAEKLQICSPYCLSVGAACEAIRPEDQNTVDPLRLIDGTGTRPDPVATLVWKLRTTADTGRAAPPWARGLAIDSDQAGALKRANHTKETIMTRVDPQLLIDPQYSAEHGYPRAAWTELRKEASVLRFQLDGWPDFWALPKHEHIVEVSEQPNLFLNAPGMTFVPTPENERKEPHDFEPRSRLRAHANRYKLRNSSR